MKKLCLLFALPLLLSGCTTSSSGGDPYQIDKNTFLYECNPDTVIFKSNYRVRMSMDDVSFMTTDFDYGKACSNGYYYHLVDKGESVELTSYRSDGTPQTSNVSKEYLYNYWFGMGQYLFEMKYEDYTYNKEKKQYECQNVQLSDFTIESGVFIAYKKKPLFIEFNIKDRGKFTVEFSDHGKVTVTFPERPTYTYSVTFDYQLAIGMSLETAINNRLGGLDATYKVEDMGNNQCRVIFTYYNYREVDIMEALLTSKGDARISNAHDTFVKLNKNVTVDGYSLLIPFDTTDNDNLTMLLETFDDIRNERTEYGEAYYYEGDESDTSYNYCLYIWYDHDPSDSFAGLSTGGYYNLLAKYHVYSTIIGDYADGFRLNFATDFNHDGMFTSDEEELSTHCVKMLQRLLNFEPDGCSFDYPEE